MLASINIQISNAKTLKAIEDIIANDPTAVISYNELNSLSPQDEARLMEISDADDRGELKYHSHEELLEHLNTLFKKMA